MSLKTYLMRKRKYKSKFISFKKIFPIIFQNVDFIINIFFILISISFIPLISSDTKCTEQWNQINLLKPSWNLIGDVSLIDDISLNSYSIQFAQSDPSSEENINLGGAIWNSYNLAGKKGIRISFKPSIIVDTAYFGNVKYPQGFAIVLTSSSTSNLIGNKGSGLGYDGINNGIAFEFDFLRQSDKEDNKKPHFSIHYNINGEISSKSDKSCTNICNLALPNFYDNTIDDYKKNMIFEIEIIGKKLSVKTNTGKTLINNLVFEPFSQLLEQEEVYIGITSTMNQNKKVNIDDFSLAEISIMEKGEIKLDNSIFTAGETISLFFSIKSTCGELLKIYPNEYTMNDKNNNTNLSLIINNVIEDPDKIVYDFNEETTILKLDISRTKTGTYTALIKFNDNYSSPVQFKVIAGNIQRFEICNEKENIIDGIYINPNLEQNKDYFTIFLCSYDQYGNSRQPDSKDAKNFLKILYPQFFTGNNDLKFDILKEKIEYQIPFSTFGQYQIFNESFKENPKRLFNLSYNRISPENSDATILHGKHLIDSKANNVILRLKLRDEFGRDIPNKIIKEMKCNFNESYIENYPNNSAIKENYEDNDIIHLVFSFDNLDEGKYTFIPKIKCEGDEYDLTLKCSETEDDEFSIYDKCAFYLNNGEKGINGNKIRLYSDFLNDYIYFANNSDENPSLLISLDEYNNKKITEFNLLDNSDYPMVDPKDYTITCKIDNIELEAFKVGYSVVILLKEANSRTQFDIIESHNLNIVITDKDNNKFVFNIDIKFVSLDKILNNMHGERGNFGIIALYQQESYVIEASENILLFEVYGINKNNNYLVKNNDIRKEEFELAITFKGKTLNSDDVILTQKEYSILISTNGLTEAGIYKLNLYRNNEAVFENLEIKVIPSGELVKLFDKENQIIEDKPIEMNGDYKYFYLQDQYDNIIKDNKAILAFSKCEIISNGLKAQINMDGKLFIYSENNSIEEKSIQIILPSGKKYEIQKKTTKKEQVLNPHKTYGLLNSNTSIFIDTQISLNLTLLDDDGNDFNSEKISEEEISNNFSVYAIEKFGIKKNIKIFDNVKKDKNILIFNTKIDSVGEYEIKIFYNNIHINCKACHFVISSNKNPDYQNTRLYILGNKRKIPVFSDNIGNSQFLLNTKDFIFHLQFYDKYFNEVPLNTQYSLSLYHSEKKNDINVKLCNYGNSKTEGRQFYHICSDQLEKFKKLQNGEYRIEVNGKMFSFYVSKDETDSSDKKPIKAIYHQYENETYGTTDNVISLIVDLRNNKNMRIDLNNNLDKIQIKFLTKTNYLNEEFYNTSLILGPEKGLFTLIANIKKVGEYSIEIYYNNYKMTSRNIKIYISCGVINKLNVLKEPKYYNGLGTYTFFEVFDINGEKCNKYINNNWNILNNEEYFINLIKAKNKKEDIYYPITKYYNHLKGVLSVIVNNDINNDIELSSDLFAFNYSINQSELNKGKLNKEYLYVNLDEDSKTIKLSMLKNNYEPYSEKDFLLEENYLSLSILKYLNDETTLVKDVEFNNTIKGFTYSEEDIHSPGDYYFVVYLNGEVVPCAECHIKVSDNIDLVSIDNTKIYLKNGYNRYLEGKKDFKNYIYKSSFPFFKINFQTNDNNLVKLTEAEISTKLKIKLNIDSVESLDTEIKTNDYNGNVYVFLNENGRSKYLKYLEKDRNIHLSIILNNNEIKLDYILFDDYSKQKNKDYEKCNLGAQPVIVNIEPSYVLRSNEKKEIEVYLEGCSELINHFDRSKFKLEINKEGIDSSEITLNAIPADTYGNFILFINYVKVIYEPVNAYIQYLNGKSSNFKISVLPGYDIYSVELFEDKTLGSPNVNYKYTYILMELKDKINDVHNIISNFGRNLFFNDINEISIIDSNGNNLPYKLSFDEERNKFRVEIPISGNGEITVYNKKNNTNNLYIKVEESQIYQNVNFNMTIKENKNYNFTMNFLDDFYKKIDSPKYFSKDNLSFIYVTENYATQEIYSIKISNFNYSEDKKEISLQLDENVPIYNTYTFIPIIGGFSQICYNCLKKNNDNNYIHSIHNNLYYPHALGNDIYLQKKYEYPMFIYFTDNKAVITTKPSNIVKQIIMNDNHSYYIFGLSNNEKNKIEIDINNKKFNITFNEENVKIDTYTKEMPIQIEKYYYNYISFISGNNGRMLDLYFYIDIRNSKAEPVYISNEYTSSLLSGYSENIKIIDYLNVFQTEIEGTYLVIIPNNKLINGKYVINFANKNKILSNQDLNTLTFHSIGAFPKLILLNNKEVIYKNMIKYDLIGQNDNSELICDERLNLYIEPKSTSKFIKGDVVNNENKNELSMNSCKLYIKFIGDINIITNIGDGFVSELTNSDNSIYNINPHYSKLNINPNIIVNGNESIELDIEFNERSSDDLSFSKDEMPVNKGLETIRYFTSTKYELRQNISGLFSSQYIFTPSQFKISILGTYLFMSSISNNIIEKPVFISYIKKQGNMANKFKVKYFEDNLWVSIDDIIKNFKGEQDKLSFKYPFKLSFNLVDENECLMKIENDKINASIVSGEGNKVNYDLKLEIKQLNDYEVLLEPNSTIIEDLIHMETKNQKSKFYIMLTYDKLNFYALLDSKIEYNLHPRVESKGYGNPSEIINNDYSLVNEYEVENIFYTIENEPNSEIYCLAKGDLIFNGNIDPRKITCTVNNVNECQGVAIVNSYRGCIKIGVISNKDETIALKYNNFNLGTLSIISLPQSKFEFNLKINKNIEVKQDNTSFGYIFTISDQYELLEIKNSKYFSIYLNGQKLKKSEYDFISSNNKEIIIKSNQFSTTPNPQKTINVFYNRGILDSENEVGEVKINIIQKEYSPQEQTFKYNAQVPVHFKAGDKPYFYLIIKDSYSACYYGKEESRISNLQNIKGFIYESFSVHQFKINSYVKLDDVPTCEYIYKLETDDQITRAKLYDIKIKDGDKDITSNTFEVQMYIAPGEFTTTSLYFNDYNSNIYAGETFHLIFTTRDKYDNQPNYYDILEHFEIKLINTETEENIKESSIKYKKIKVAETKQYIEITMIVIESAEYNVKVFYNNTELELNSILKLNVMHKDCSFYNPILNISKIDERNYTFYSGEEVEINIYCSDQFGNLIKKPGSENFKAIINNNNIGHLITYEHTFDKIHKVYFTTEDDGIYEIQILLNGKTYYDTIKIKVEKFNETLFMCMNKIQVEDLKDCLNITSYENYEQLIRNIEGNENICNKSLHESDFDEGKVFTCKMNNQSVCTYNTSYCDCDENYNEINGYCYPNEINPISLVNENRNKVNCIAILRGQGITNAIECEDGSCRLNEEYCNTRFECPIGFKSCGNNCILLNEKCKLENKCGEDEVLCWDYSCANTYSLCPTRKTCPKEKILCPDGTCQYSGHCPQPITRKCQDNKYQCPDFSCVKDKNDCKKNKICPVGQSLCEDDICRDECKIIENNQYKCSNGQYVNNSQLCPSEMECPKTWIKCPEGGCAKSLEGCNYIQVYKQLVCPKNKPILCPDYECVETFESCKKNYPICPPHKPYKCWNNECRKSFNECPTQISCPLNSPLLCTNGLCVDSINNCKEKNDNVFENCKNDPNKIRCFDGTCANSIDLCPTHSYCGKNKIKCWNGACVDSINNCLSVNSLEPCLGDLGYRCPDGTCRNNQESCSTMTICPSSLPIKCFDNSCRATIDECPEYESCGKNKVSCPDGTCAKSFDECNTVVTCSGERPFLCFDGSCSPQLEDCPSPPSCGSKYVQCPDGSCTTSRQFCKIFSACEAKTPVRCQVNICAEDLNRCPNPNNRECPIGYVKCLNGDCKILSSLCEENKCPSHTPYRCPEGVCVLNKNFCDDEITGCPYNAKYKCRDGTCAKNENECDEIEKKKKDEIYKDLCPDGSNKREKKNCPLRNGCPSDKKLKCADGSCINPDLSECPTVFCPKNKPIKCLNGLCVVKSSECPSMEKNDDILNDNLVMCLDGRKVPSYDYCRPIFECPSPYKRCMDGTCREEENCPKYIECPKERPFRIHDGLICSSINSTYYTFCQNEESKCEYTGECMNNTDKPNKCLSPLNRIGCPKENQTRCDNGRCMNSELECILSNKACPDDDKPFLCNNGQCVSDLSECKDNECEKGFTRCYNGRCVEDNEESYMQKCTNEIGCPLNQPYRCSNGECVSSERKCKIFSEIDNNKTLNTICDSSKPYLCRDYSCVSDYKFCKYSTSVPEGYFECFNGYHVKNKQECEKYNDYCPQSIPIRCPSGSCSSNIINCPETSPKESCNEGEFYCVRLGKCVKKKSECLINYKKNSNEFLFESQSGVLCYDGTIAQTGEKCPIVQSCKVGQFRCENGACAYNKTLCSIDNEYKCKEDEKKCPDGLCHKDCNEVAYQGCLVGEYLCSNGMCVKSEIECAGYSMCEDPSVPYRCINGECKSDITLCPEVERLSSVKNISFSFNKNNKIEFDFAFDPKGRSIGKIIILSQSIQLNTNYSKINIQEFSTSLIHNNSLYNNTPEFLYNVSNGIEGSDGVLNFENSIVAPVFKFFSEELSEIKFNIPALLILEHNIYISSSFHYSDYCLANLSNFDMKNDKLNSNGDSKWECIQRFESEEQKEFVLNEFGVYTIILNPLRNKRNYLEGGTKNFIFENMKVIIILLIIAFVIGIIIYYVFSRVMRYRGKYHENRAKIELLKQQREEYKQMQTDVFGQTLGDNLIGIVYAKNPGYNEEDEELKNVGGLENEIEEIERQCRNMEMQNERLKNNLDQLENEYKQVNAEIEEIKNNN